MIIKEKRKEKIKIIVKETVPKLERILKLMEKKINFFTEDIAENILCDKVYRDIYIARAYYIIYIIKMITEITGVTTLGKKAYGLTALFSVLSKDLKSLPNNVTLNYCDMQFLYKSVLEITNNFLRYDKKENSYYCKFKIDVYEMIKSIDKFSYIVRYVLKNKVEYKKALDTNKVNAPETINQEKQIQ